MQVLKNDKNMCRIECVGDIILCYSFNSPRTFKIFDMNSLKHLTSMAVEKITKKGIVERMEFIDAKLMTTIKSTKISIDYFAQG